MARLAVGPIKQAFVRALRDISALQAEVGSGGIDEGIALPGSGYPRVVYSVASVGRSRQFGSEGITIATIDCWVVSDDQVEAHNLDQLVLDGLEEATLDFVDAANITPGEEPSTLLCRRIRDVSFVDSDDAGNRVYRVGGSYQIWLDRI